MARRRAKAVLYVGIKHHVIAIDRATGAELWRVKLEGLRFKSHDFVGLHLAGEELYATCNGELFCLDAGTGTIRWHNQFKGLGTGVVSVLTELPSDGGQTRDPSPPTTVAEELQRRAQQRQAAAAAG